jgi:hypothetical protein
VTPSEKASNARQILENQVLQEAFIDLASRLHGSWEASHPDKWKDREAIFNQLQALKDLKAQLESYIHTAALDSTAKVQHGRTERYNARDI